MVRLEYTWDGSCTDCAVGNSIGRPKKSSRRCQSLCELYRYELYGTGLRSPRRRYYERNNYLIQQYSYIDRLLDSSLPHSLLQEYNQLCSGLDIPTTIVEEPRSTPVSPDIAGMNGNTQGMDSIDKLMANEYSTKTKIKRTPKDLYKVPDEERPLLEDDDTAEDSKPNMPQYEPEESSDSSDRIVTVAIYLNLVANTTLLILKIIVAVLTDSLSVLASLVDAALDFLSTAIVWTTTRLISRRDQYSYPVGRRRLEPIGVLVFSVIMITSFFQVALEGINRLRSSGDHTLVRLTIPAIAIMASTVVIKFLCWLWCRFIKNSSVQALAQDAMTDVVFNIFSIIFPLSAYPPVASKTLRTTVLMLQQSATTPKSGGSTPSAASSSPST